MATCRPRKPAYPAILELLERGTTNRLPTAPPSAARGGAASFRALPQASAVSRPQAT